MQFEMGISTRRNFPPKGTAGFDLDCVKGNKRVPFPPPRMIDTTSDITRLHFSKKHPFFGQKCRKTLLLLYNEIAILSIEIVKNRIKP
jgi:hypothetical protein